MTEKTQKDMVTIQVSRLAGTRELAHECARMTPKDEFGRQATVFGVIHRGLMMYKESLLRGGATTISRTEIAASIKRGRPRKFGPSQED